jgi:nicotinate-nucleotide adenylyltransferase
MPTDLSAYQRILLFGGSFDPPHRAHVELPQQAGRAIGADLIAYIPAGRAPHKLDKEQTDPRHRLAMLRLALQVKPGPIPTAVLTDEIDRGPDEPSYTVDTLSAIRGRLGPYVKLRLLIGADQLRIFDQWREPERIIALAEPVVMVRPPDTRATLLDALPPDQRESWRNRLVEVDAIDLSSTDIRERLATGQSVDDLIAPSVAAYARQHNLYE